MNKEMGGQSMKIYEKDWRKYRGYRAFKTRLLVSHQLDQLAFGVFWAICLHFSVVYIY